MRVIAQYLQKCRLDLLMPLMRHHRQAIHLVVVLQTRRADHPAAGIDRDSMPQPGIARVWQSIDVTQDGRWLASRRKASSNGEQMSQGRQ